MVYVLLRFAVLLLGLVKHLGGSVVALKGGRHNKWCADEGDRIRCNRNAIGSWERFTYSHRGGKTVAFKGGRHGKWCADEGGNTKCNRNGIGSWEVFEVNNLSGGSSASANFGCMTKRCY